MRLANITNEDEITSNLLNS